MDGVYVCERECICVGVSVFVSRQTMRKSKKREKEEREKRVKEENFRVTKIDPTDVCCSSRHQPQG